MSTTTKNNIIDNELKSSEQLDFDEAEKAFNKKDYQTSRQLLEKLSRNLNSKSNGKIVFIFLS